jgi:hypothetical protein
MYLNARTHWACCKLLARCMGDTPTPLGHTTIHSKVELGCSLGPLLFQLHCMVGTARLRHAARSPLNSHPPVATDHGLLGLAGTCLGLSSRCPMVLGLVAASGAVMYCWTL